MASLDLEDAYFLVPVDIGSRKYLRFIFDGQFYQFTCLTFRRNVSPWIFRKNLKPVMGFLRKKGLTSVIYLDDIICIENTFHKYETNVNTTVTVLKSLEFIVNKKNVI